MNEKLMEREQVDESKFAPPTLKQVSFPTVEHRSKVRETHSNNSLVFISWKKETKSRRRETSEVGREIRRNKYGRREIRRNKYGRRKEG
jgi:hypothetical protein